MACRPLHSYQLPCGNRGASDVADLSLPDEVIERAQRFFDWCQRIQMMHLIEIDPIRLQTFETRLDRSHDVAARRAFHGTRIVHRRAELGRKDDVLAPIAEKL